MTIFWIDFSLRLFSLMPTAVTPNERKAGGRNIRNRTKISEGLVG